MIRSYSRYIDLLQVKLYLAIYRCAGASSHGNGRWND